MIPNLHQLKKSLARQGLELPGDKPDEDRAMQLKTAYQDYVADMAESDNDSDISDASTKPSNGSNKKRKKVERSSNNPNSNLLKKHTFSANLEDEGDEDDFECKLCDGGFALGDDQKKMCDLELLWIQSLEEQPKNASLSVFVKQALKFYDTEIRPYSIKQGHDYGEMTFKEMRAHLVRHVKTLALERLFQIEIARKMYLRYNKVENAQLDDKVIDTKSSDQCLKYMNHSNKLLKDKDKEEKFNKMMLTSANR